jgi:hypothetical protein
VVLVLVVASCGTFPVRGRIATFDAEEYAPYRAPGTATVCGTVLTGDGWGVKLARNQPVRLIPGTSYGAEEFEISRLGVPAVAQDARAKAAERRVFTDDGGYFTFSGVPAGRWYLVAEVRWTGLGLLGFGEQDGPVGVEIEARDGETKDVTLWW